MSPPPVVDDAGPDAEPLRDLPRSDQIFGRCTVDANGEPFISTTSTDAGGAILRVTHPIWLETGTPLDGLHSVIGLTMRFASGAATDLHLTPLRHAAGEWPT